jgi:uncharacterized protein
MASQKEWLHPCLKCGACCAYFRVSFYWREAETTDSEKPVPAGLFEEQSDRFRCMKGTNEKRANRCVSLHGQIGNDVKCEIYENRPSPCRDFEASFEGGIKNPRCDKARRAHDLEALGRDDWPKRP